jgi:hypothetical protein
MYHHQPINLPIGLPYGLHIRRACHNLPRGPSADWWVLTANAAGTNGLTCLPKHGRARDNKFWVTHPMTDQFCLSSAIARRSALTAGLSSSLLYMFQVYMYIICIIPIVQKHFSITPARSRGRVLVLNLIKSDVCLRLPLKLGSEVER